MNFRNLFNHVNDNTKYDDIQESYDQQEVQEKKTRTKEHGIRESELLRRKRSRKIRENIRKRRKEKILSRQKAAIEEKIDEDSLLTGGSTVANDPDYANPHPVSKPEPEIKKEETAEVTDSPEEPKEDEREIPLEGDKEYLGNKGGDEYFYFVVIPAEDGTKDLQIQDANDEVLFSAKENQLDVGNTEDFLWKGIQEMELSNIALEIVDKYLLPDEKPEDVEMEETEEETTGEETPDVDTETPEPDSSKIKTQGGFPSKSHMGESKVKENQENGGLIRRLMEKYGVNEAFETKEEFIEFLKNHIIPELEYQGNDEAIKAFYEAIEWMGGAGTGEQEPEQEEKKLYTIDLDRLYKTGDVGESKMMELLEKFGLTESKVDILMEKFGLVDEATPRPEMKDLDKTITPGEGGAPSPDILTAPGEEPIAGPDEEHMSADAEPAPEGGEPKAEEVISPESAKSDIQMQYPEEPFTSTALAYADSLVDEPKVYGAIRDLRWQGKYANSETFLKQAKIVGNYNEFTPDIAKRLVDAVGEGAKYRLAREGSVAVYFTVRDTDKKISLETLRDLVRAQEIEATGNPGEARVWWD